MPPTSIKISTTSPKDHSPSFSDNKCSSPRNKCSPLRQRPPSVDNKQHGTQTYVDPKNPEATPRPNTVFTLNLTDPIPRAARPLINEPPVPNRFQYINYLSGAPFSSNSTASNREPPQTNQVRKITCFTAPAHKMPNMPVGQNFGPDMSLWFFRQHRQSNNQAADVNNMPSTGQTKFILSKTNIPPHVCQNSAFN